MVEWVSNCFLSVGMNELSVLRLIGANVQREVRAFHAGDILFLINDLVATQSRIRKTRGLESKSDLVAFIDKSLSFKVSDSQSQSLLVEHLTFSDELLNSALLKLVKEESFCRRSY